MYDQTWSGGGRGFWTKRKKTATSLVAVVALIAGIAVAFKLFDRTVPNNVVRDAAVFDFTIHKQDSLIGDQTWQAAGPAPDKPIFEAGIDTFPGDTRSVDVKITNTNVEPAKDASFQMHIDQPSITVKGCYDATGKPLGVVEDDAGNVTCPAGATTAAPTVVAQGGPASAAWVRFVNFWTVDVDKQLVLVAAGQDVNEDDHQGENRLTAPNGNPDDSGNRRYGDACEGGLRTLTPASPCQLGKIEGAGSSDLLGESTDVRYYKFKLTEIDDGTDQSAFKGWDVTFSMVFNARVPAIAESSSIVSER